VRKHRAGEERIALGLAMNCLGELSRLRTEGDSLGHGLDESENFLDRKSPKQDPLEARVATQLSKC